MLLGNNEPSRCARALSADKTQAAHLHLSGGQVPKSRHCILIAIFGLRARLKRIRRLEDGGPAQWLGHAGN